MSQNPQGLSVSSAHIAMPRTPNGPIKTLSTGKKAPSASAPKEVGKGTFTCPMHPEVQSDHPGTCPKCGMALEPTTAATTEEEENPELSNMRRRFWFSAALSLPLVILAMGDVVTGGLVSRLVSPQTKIFVELALATLVCTWAAWPFYVRAVQSVRNRSLNMFTLVGLGAGTGRHRHGHWHRRRHGERVYHARKGRPDGHRPSPSAVPKYDAQHQAKSVLRPLLQCGGGAHCGWCALSPLRAAYVTRLRCRGDELQFGVGDWQCAALAAYPCVKWRPNEGP
jgi:hypothetical protein